MPNTISVNRIELLKFYDCRPADSIGHATAINAVAGEDLACGILRHYFAAVKKVQIEISPHVCTQGTPTGKRLDRWITVRNGPEGVVHYQTEIKNWSAHSLGGKEIGIDVALDHMTHHKKRCWSVEWDHSRRTLKKSTAKVLIPMKKIFGDPVEPLLCMWAPMHPDGAEHPWFIVDLPEGEHFRRLNVFSISSYLRTLTDAILKLEMPHALARITWLDRLFTVANDDVPASGEGCDADGIQEENIEMDVADGTNIILAVPVGKTIHENLELGLYYSPISRSFKPHRYLALYTNKSIVAIGKVERIVQADLIDGAAVLKPGQAQISAAEASRITAAINLAPTHGFNIARDRNFFLVHKFETTDFRKISPGGMAGKRYFDLHALLGHFELQEPPTAYEVANRLSGLTWE